MFDYVKEPIVKSFQRVRNVFGYAGNIYR